MFKVSIKDKKYENKTNKDIEEKIALYLDISKNNLETNTINENYINPWSDIKETYVAKASDNKITILKLDIPNESKNKFFANKYKDLNLDFMVIPEKYIVGVNVVDKEDGTFHDVYLNNLKKMTFAYIRNEDFNNKLDNIKVEDKVLDDYRFGNGKKKFLVARTSRGNYFLSKNDLDYFKDNPIQFLMRVNKLKYNNNDYDINNIVPRTGRDLEDKIYSSA